MIMVTTIELTNTQPPTYGPSLQKINAFCGPSAYIGRTQEPWAAANIPVSESDAFKIYFPITAPTSLFSSLPNTLKVPILIIFQFKCSEL